MFRCDASYQIGSGHVMRCLTLADALARHGVLCSFVTRKLPGNIVGRIAEHAHRTHLLETPHHTQRELSGPTEGYRHWLGVAMEEEIEQSVAVTERLNPDMVIVDHYALDYAWHRRVGGTRPLMAIDDLANRQHECELLLDQNFGRHSVDYAALVSPESERLIGPNYALLRPEFRAKRHSSLARRRSELDRIHILVSMGGADQDNSTARILNALSRSSLMERIDVTIVMGSAARHLRSVHKQADEMPYPAAVLSNVSDMASLLVDVDMAIGAAGGSVWERCCLGVPSLLLNIAENQKPATVALDQAKAAVAIGDFHSGEWEDHLLLALEKWSDGEQLRRASQRVAEIVDGKGTSRVAERVMHHLGLNGVEA